MTTTTRVVKLADEHATLVVEALRADAHRRQRAATRAAAELEADDTTSDKRPGSVRIARMLAEAAALERAAGELEDGPRLAGVDELANLTATGTTRDLLAGVVGDALADAGVLAPGELLGRALDGSLDAWRDLLDAVRVATIDEADEQADAAVEATAVERARALGLTSSLDEDEPADPIAVTTTPEES